MKRLLPFLAVLLSSCVVHSINPFYTEKSRVKEDELLGTWKLVKSYGTDLSTNNISPWTIVKANEASYNLLAYDEKNVDASFHLVFFKLGKALFLDFIPDDPSDEAKLNAYWRLSVRPVHGICKVITNGDQLQLIPLNFDWLKENLVQKRFSISYEGSLDLPLLNSGMGDLPLFTATSAQWEAFLQKYANTPEAFPSDHAIILKRIVEKKP